MATISYKSQPAIHKTRGAIPPEGTSHIYKVTKLLWPQEIEAFLGDMLIGRSLHICCGKSTIGDVRLDLYESNVDIKADAARLPFKNNSFDTVLIDAPYNSKFRWMHDMLEELSRVSTSRIIHQHWFLPVNKFGQYRKNHNFELIETYIWQPKTYFGRVNVISIFDRK